MNSELPKWARELAKRWNAETNSVFILSGNIFDVYPVQNDSGDVSYASLKSFLSNRIFPKRKMFLTYDISEGLRFGNADMQSDFMAWLSVWDEIEKKGYSANGLPRDFNLLAPLLKGYFKASAALKNGGKDKNGYTLFIGFPEKIVPSSDESMASKEERQATVTFLNWATSDEFRRLDVGIFLVTESAGELNPDLLSNPHIAQIEIGLPDEAERVSYLEKEWGNNEMFKKAVSDGGLSLPDVGARTSGLNLIRTRNLILEAVHNSLPISPAYISMNKKRLIEEFCQGLVRFKEPVPGRDLSCVATHSKAKEKLSSIAFLIKNGKLNVVEKGILIPGRVGVGKSWLVDCFASECGLPVLELGEFRSKWVGDTERQLARILLTLKALGPVVVVVDEADQVFGSSRDSGSGDSGVSGRVFASLAAHIGDASLRGKELWFAMTSRPDLLAIDMKRQGRFGLCIPLFPAQDSEETIELFEVVCKTKGVELQNLVRKYITCNLGEKELTGSEVESIVIRAMEKAVLSGRDEKFILSNDFMDAIKNFIDPLDPNLIRLQTLAGVIACSDLDFLPKDYRMDRQSLHDQFNKLKETLRL